MPNEFNSYLETEGLEFCHLTGDYCSHIKDDCTKCKYQKDWSDKMYEHKPQRIKYKVKCGVAANGVENILNEMNEEGYVLDRVVICGQYQRDLLLIFQDIKEEE